MSRSIANRAVVWSLIVGTLICAILLRQDRLWKAARASQIADYDLGMKYFRGDAEVRIDHNKAIEHLRRAADAGLPEAQVEMALLYHNGGTFDWLGAADYGQAKLWAKRAVAGGLQEKAMRGDSRAQFALGELYLSGLTDRSDIPKASEWLERAAAAGNSDAERALGFIYLSGHGVSKDVLKARGHFERAASANNSPAQKFLALLYSGGYEGIPEEDHRAIEYLRSAGERGDAAAEYELGLRYEKGKGVPQSFTTAAEYYQRAASRGFWGGLLNLGMLYETGKGLPRDRHMAAELYRALAARNFKSGKEALQRLEGPQPSAEPERQHPLSSPWQGHVNSPNQAIQPTPKDFASEFASRCSALISF